MNKAQRLIEYQDDVDNLTVEDIDAAGQESCIAWSTLYWQWIFTGSMPPMSGGDRPPHKPPTP